MAPAADQSNYKPYSPGPKAYNWLGRRDLTNSKNYSTGYEDYFEKQCLYQKKVAELAAQGFPHSKPDVVVGHSGPQGKVVPLTIIDDPADWTAASWQGREDEYTYVLTEADITELQGAVKELKARGLSTEDDIKGLSKDDFPLPTLGPKLVALAKEVSHGRAFQFIKNFPVHWYKTDPWGLIAAYWGIGLHLGRLLITQSDFDEKTGKTGGSILNHIVNLGYLEVEGRRQPHSGNPLSFHADQAASDIISLLCLSSAVEGGASKWVSSIAIHNELLRRGRKDLVEVLSKPFLLPKRVDQTLLYKNEKGQIEFEEIIPFEYHDGYLSVYFQSLAYFDIEKIGLKLTPLQEEAIWAVAVLAEDPKFHFRHTLKAGDLEWVHNPSIFHAREAYTDGEADDQKRHLVRWWVHSDTTKRPIAPTYAPRSSVFAGGGFKVPQGTVLRLPVLPIGKQTVAGDGEVKGDK